MMDERLIVALSSGGGGSCYGYHLSDLTLRHVLGLLMLDSPVLSGGYADDLDVVMAARLLSSSDDASWWGALGRGSRWERWCAWWRGLRYGKMSRRERERENLFSWLEGEMLGPRLLDGKGGKALKVHWLVVMVCVAMRECGCSMGEAWWMRFSDIGWARLTWAEQDGAEFTLLTDGLIEEMREMGYTDEDLGI